MAYKVFVDGQQGTTGLEIYQRLEKRDDVEILRIDPALRKDVLEKKRLINLSDVTILCLPDDAARESVALIENPDVRVIDASTAHRTNDASIPIIASKTRSFSGFNAIFQTENRMILNCMHNDFWESFIVVNKKVNEGVYYKYAIDPYGEKPVFKIIGCSKDFFISEIRVNKILDWKGNIEEMDKVKNEKLRDIIAKISLEDNPCLCFYK